MPSPNDAGSAVPPGSSPASAELPSAPPAPAVPPGSPPASAVPPRWASRPKPRPRFTLYTPLTPTEVRDRVRAFIQGSRRVRGIAFEHRIELAVGGHEHHFWSPQIVAEVTAVDGGARIDCRFGPDPYVWALYIMLYVTMLVCFVFALIFGFVQLGLGQEPLGLYLAPAALAAAGLVYGASFVGQGLGSEQMFFLRSELTRVTEGRPEPVGAAERASVPKTTA